MRSVSISDGVRCSLQRAVARSGSNEFIAALGGSCTGGHAAIHALHELPNHAIAKDRFAVDPLAFAAAEHALRMAGRPWLGFVHSHPTGDATPSSFDRRWLWRACVQLIVAGPPTAGAVRAFWLLGDALHELPMLPVTAVAS